MTFVLEAVRTRRGSALLLHYGMASKLPSRILIDCGADGSYQDSVRPRLEQLRAGAPAPLPVELILASQMDCGHLQEMELLFQDIQDGQATIQPCGLWLNKIGDEATHSANQVVDRLLKSSQSLGIPVNRPFEPHEIRADTKAIPFGDGLSIEVLAPHGHAEQPTGTAPILLFRKGDQSMLIAGNASGLSIVTALVHAGYLDKDETKAVDDPFHVNLMAITQTEEASRLTSQYFKKITADSYLFAGNPRHGNPNAAMLHAVGAARGDDDFNVYFTVTASPTDASFEKRAVLDWVADDMPGGCVAIFRDDAPDRFSTLVELPA